MSAQISRLDEIRQSALGRGREVEVQPSGEITPVEDSDNDVSEDQPVKASKMQPHTFGD